MGLQAVKDFSDMVDRFEKRVFDLKTSKTIAIQTAPQIRLIQNNDKALVEKISDTINSVIPIWKSQIVIAVGLAKQQKIVDLDKSVSDAVNEGLKRNADMLEQTTIDVAKQAQRSTVDVSTLKHVNDRLINTIEKTLEIQKQGKENRIKAEQELLQIKANLKEAVTRSIQ